MTLKKLMEMIAEFHAAAGYPGQPGTDFLSKEMKSLWQKLITEEYNELVSAMNKDDFIGTVHEIGDLIYALLGACHVWHVPVGEILEEIHACNMRKVASPDIRRREDGKILKGDLYVDPCIREILVKHGVIKGP